MSDQSCSRKKKNDRKFSKYRNILFKETGINPSEKPDCHLMLCNAGLASGISECNIIKLFSDYGQLESVAMPFGKSYSFVSFSTTFEAAAAFEKVHGKKVFEKMNGQLYLLYTMSVPEINHERGETSYPGGLHLIENFITESEEEKFLKCINWCDTGSNIGKSELKHRRVKHYGYEFNYSCNNVDKNQPMSEKIPEECQVLFSRLRNQGFENVLTWIPDQLTVNEYQPGQGIPSHVDTHSAFESPILSLSLGSDIIMDFKHHDGRHLPILLPQRSLLIMDGESRYDWSHGIAQRKMDVVQYPDNGLITKKRGTRTSFTFRKIHCAPCNCKYPVHCDSQQTEKCIQGCEASYLEALHVHQVYEDISTHFSETRHKPWPNVAKFVDSLEPGAVLADVGCGNGKYFGFNKNIFELGCDRSFNLSEECHGRGNEVFTCNCLQLPLRSNSMDAVICIAVIHHLSTNERRLGALKEMSRILRIGGQGLVYVWAKDQLKDKKMSSYLKQDRKNRIKDTNSSNEQKSDKNDPVTITGDDSVNCDVKNTFLLPVHKNRTQFEHEDLLVPWKMKTDKEKIFYRYYHVFKEGELENLFLSIVNVKIVKSYYDQGNWCVIFEKIQ